MALDKFTFRGLVKEKLPGRNQIRAFTPNMLVKLDWLSKKAGDCDGGLWVINLIKGVNDSKHLVLLVPPPGNAQTADFIKALKEKQKTSLVQILVTNQDLHKDTMAILLKDVTVVWIGPSIDPAFPGLETHLWKVEDIDVQPLP